MYFTLFYYVTNSFGVHFVFKRNNNKETKTLGGGGIAPIVTSPLVKYILVDSPTDFGCRC